jgi:hypothetical protein
MHLAVVLLLLLTPPWQQPRDLLMQLRHGLTYATTTNMLLLLL